MKTYRNSSFSFLVLHALEICTTAPESTQTDDDFETRRVLEVTLVGVSVAGSLQ